VRRALRDALPDAEVDIGDDDGPYENVMFDVGSPQDALSALGVVFDSAAVGPSARAACIVTCQGERGWDDYLLLHHFDATLTRDIPPRTGAPYILIFPTTWYWRIRRIPRDGAANRGRSAADRARFREIRGRSYTPNHAVDRLQFAALPFAPNCGHHLRSARFGVGLCDGPDEPANRNSRGHDGRRV
jgi:hypothetical protein